MHFEAASFHVWVWLEMTRGTTTEVQQPVCRHLVSAHGMKLQVAREYVG
ncbi:hypothetical protein MF271_20085 (plasmid) [Deinococcus sp. KNUC1210]|nr:hypothetical protein [Deinococcus sp. KNUC1210]ULH17710.1 hypothetical protein MF271_20085 [Deinococcus sp. KNUC1210]